MSTSDNACAIRARRAPSPSHTRAIALSACLYLRLSNVAAGMSAPRLRRSQRPARGPDHRSRFQARRWHGSSPDVMIYASRPIFAAVPALFLARFVEGMLSRVIPFAFAAFCCGSSRSSAFSDDRAKRVHSRSTASASRPGHAAPAPVSLFLLGRLFCWADLFAGPPDHSCVLSRTRAAPLLSNE